VTCQENIIECDKYLTCINCKERSHELCVDKINLGAWKVTWLCCKCANCALPFTAIDDDAEYANAIFRFCNGLRFSSKSFEFADELCLTSKLLKIDKEIDFNVNFPNTHIQCNYITEDQLKSSVSINSTETFSIRHINARSLVKNINNVTSLVSSFKRKPSVIAITETRTGVD